MFLREIICESYDEPTFPKSVVEAFRKLGDDQRGVPERAMVQAQSVVGGGLLQYAIEHIGDLTHRMSGAAGPLRNWALGAAEEKVVKIARDVNRQYGFAKEVEEQYKSNANYNKMPLDQFKARAKAALEIYADEHAKLVVYNRAQWLGRETAIALGRQNFDAAKTYLNALLTMVKDGTFDDECSKYQLDASGNPIPYTLKTT